MIEKLSREWRIGLIDIFIFIQKLFDNLQETLKTMLNKENNL